MSERERQRETERETDRQRDRQRQTETDRGRQRQTETERQRDRERCLHSPEMVESQARVSPSHAGFVFVGAAVDSVLGSVGVQTPHPVASLHEVFPDVVTVVGGTARSSPVVTEF